MCNIGNLLICGGQDDGCVDRKFARINSTSVKIIHIGLPLLGQMHPDSSPTTLPASRRKHRDARCWVWEENCRTVTIPIQSSRYGPRSGSSIRSHAATKLLGLLSRRHPEEAWPPCSAVSDPLDPEMPSSRDPVSRLQGGAEGDCERASGDNQCLAAERRPTTLTSLEAA
jgi:hypothetical protein